VLLFKEKEEALSTLKKIDAQYISSAVSNIKIKGKKTCGIKW
jgi:hypothetical protein